MVNQGSLLLGAWMRELGLSTRAAASILSDAAGMDVSHVTVSRYADASSVPDRLRALALHRALGIAVDAWDREVPERLRPKTN